MIEQINKQIENKFIRIFVWDAFLRFQNLHCFPKEEPTKLWLKWIELNNNSLVMSKDNHDFCALVFLDSQLLKNNQTNDCKPEVQMFTSDLQINQANARSLT